MVAAINERMPTVASSPLSSVVHRWREDYWPIYADDEVRHCWLIDPAVRRLEVSRLTETNWTLLAMFRQCDAVGLGPRILRAPDSRQGRPGLQNMRERLALLGGLLQMSQSAGKRDPVRGDSELDLAPQSKITLLLCDDHRLFREGLAALLGQQPHWQIVGEAADGDEAVRRVAELGPSLVVLDVGMPGMSGIDAAAAIRECAPGTRVVALSMYADDHHRQRMLAAGASAYVLKSEASADLIAAIEAVLRGEIFISPSLESPVAPGGSSDRRTEAGRGVAQGGRERLTPRERDVLRLMALGRRTKDVARELGISAKTVETHRSRIMLKLGIDNLAGLIRFAIRAGIVEAD